ncbi:sensor histidine kinase [Luteimonas panaciterrae]|uniref:sensor histidine kinase n=1 Tax=Luteimonas panaciterrae TaxID=363885 RepID=UPI001CFAE9B5|nr:HAMP domain-containing sensor histidine kinase [Luteimonas panaciterrae]
MPQGLPRKLRYAFILQAVLMSLAIAIGIVVAGAIVREMASVERLRAEAQYYWTGRATNPRFPLPTTSTVRSYFLAPGASPNALPRELRGIQPGVSKLPGTRYKVLLEQRPQGRLYIVMSFPVTDATVIWTATISILLALLAVVAATWVTYRISKRLVTPVNWLAEQVSRWQPGDPDTGAMANLLARSRVPDDDRSEVGQLSAALRGLIERVHDFVRRERDFTRDASHELRTPLTVIRVATDMMIADPETSPRSQRALSRMQRAGRDMEAVIDAFLILAREDGDSALLEDFDVSAVVDDEAEKARARLRNKPVELVVTAYASPRLYASPRALAVILDKLLDNACTFTDQGRVEVILENDRIIVQDTGIGMSPEILSKAYDPFYRADIFGRGGKGMGLSIVRRLGERFGWQVTLDSAPGVGTTATIGFTRHLIG